MFPPKAARDSSTSLDMTREEISNCLFSCLDVYHDMSGWSAAMNMSIDEALLEYATDPVIRFYRWQSPALSFGYFGRFADVAKHQGKRDLVRRWTGGGIVFHGEDLTYSVVIPISDAVFCESSTSIYEKIHRALGDVLMQAGHATLLGTEIATNGPGYNCFENPVRADVMINGRKVAGAAQRRTRCGLLQQGSIQGVNLEKRLAQQFARELSADRRERKFNADTLNRARELAGQKYGSDAWLRKR
jgi:lipoate-protein ligase A